MDYISSKTFLSERSPSQGVCHVPFSSMVFTILFGIGTSWLQKKKTNKNMMFFENTFVWKLKKLQDYVPMFSMQKKKHFQRASLAILLESTFRTSSPQDPASNSSIDASSCPEFSMGNRIDRKAFSISPLQKLSLSCFCPGTFCKTFVSLRLQLLPSSTHFRCRHR